MPRNELVYNGHTYAAEIVGGVLDMDHTMVGETLSVDTLKIVTTAEDSLVRVIAEDQEETDFIVTEDDAIICVFDGSPAPVYTKNGAGLFYIDGSLVGKYYLADPSAAVKQTGKHKHELYFYSAIKLLTMSDHYGGMYSGETVGNIIADIIGNIVPYTIDVDIANKVVDKGYLPIAPRRDNMQMVLMAYGAHVRNAPDGSLRITVPSQTTTGEFDMSRVFTDGAVADKTPATAAQVTEHNYIEDGTEVVVYDNATVGTETIKFSEPYHSLRITGGTKVSEGVNYCTFTGSGSCVIYGKKYIHVTRVVTYGKIPTGSPDDVVKPSTNNTMLGPSNAAQFAEAFYKYASVQRTITQKVIVGTERPGDVVSIINPFTLETVSACMKSLKATIGTKEIIGQGEFLQGYVPGSVNTFDNHELLTGSGSWTAPDKNGDGSDYLARFILVGSGDSGGGGYPGANSVPGTTEPVLGGVGGNPGTAGAGAYILEFNMTVTPFVSYEFNCGVGVAGGAESSAGALGNATTFAGYSSALGRRFPAGYKEPKTGLTFAENGTAGLAGGRGNNFGETTGVSIAYKGVTYTAGSNGSDYAIPYTGIWRGGGGGGPAAGANGLNGADATYKRNGNGGTGANAVDADDATQYGGGGPAGHGGGGAGFVAGYSSSGSPGIGGHGSKGGKSGNGCIVAYY